MQKRKSIMKNALKVMLAVGIIVLISFMGELPVKAYTSDSDIPAPTGVSVPEKSIEDSIRISWDPITWPSLDPGTAFGSSLDEVGYIVYYGKDFGNLEHKWIYSSKDETERCSTYIDGLENGTYYVIVCAGTRRMSRIGDISYTYTPGKESEVKTVTVNLTELEFIISGETYKKGYDFYENIKAGKKKTFVITSNADMELALDPLNYLAKNKNYCKVKRVNGGKTLKLSFTKKAEKGKYYFSLTGPDSSKQLVEITVYENYPGEIKDFEVSKQNVKSGKKSTVKVTTYLDDDVFLEPVNDLAQNTKYVKVKNGQTGKITFSKNAQKGKYEFQITIKKTYWLTTYTTFTIEVK